MSDGPTLIWLAPYPNAEHPGLRRRHPGRIAHDGPPVNFVKERFFREGRGDQWRDVVPDTVADRVIRDHGAIIPRVNYV